MATIKWPQINSKPYVSDNFVAEIRRLNKTYGDDVVSFVADSDSLQSLFRPGTVNRALKSYPAWIVTGKRTVLS